MNEYFRFYVTHHDTNYDVYNGGYTINFRDIGVGLPADVACLQAHWWDDDRITIWTPDASAAAEAEQWLRSAFENRAQLVNELLRRNQGRWVDFSVRGGRIELLHELRRATSLTLNDCVLEGVPALEEVEYAVELVDMVAETGFNSLRAAGGCAIRRSALPAIPFPALRETGDLEIVDPSIRGTSSLVFPALRECNNLSIDLQCSNVRSVEFPALRWVIGDVYIYTPGVRVDLHHAVVEGCVYLPDGDVSWVARDVRSGVITNDP